MVETSLMEFLDLMFKPFLACLILTGIHAYLGLHVISREVIFVDLALAQIAALGTSFALLLGWEMHSTAGYFTALTFALVGAAIFAACRHRQPVVPQEAAIGIVYAVAAAASILVLSKAPQGSEEFQGLLVGHLLFVEWNEILRMAFLYAVIGFLHWKMRRPLLLISENSEAAFASGMNVRLWDFLFYGTFAVVVTSSTELAGVLLVFSFLIVPAVCGLLLASGIRQRLAVGWLVGTLTSAVGIAASYFLDLPTGATVVCCFAIALLACLVVRRIG